MEKLIELWERGLFYLSEFWEMISQYTAKAWEAISPFLKSIWEMISRFTAQAWEAISPLFKSIWEKFMSEYCQFGAVCSDGNLSWMGGAIIAVIGVSIIVLIFAVIYLVRNS